MADNSGGTARRLDGGGPFPYKRTTMALIAVLAWISVGLLRRPLAWATAALTALYAPVVEGLAPHGITSGTGSSATTLEVAFVASLVGVWLGGGVLREGELFFRGRGPLASTCLRGTGLGLAALMLALPATAAGAFTGPLSAPDILTLGLALFHLTGVALIIDRVAPDHRGIALFATSWVLPILLMADRGRVGIVTAIPSALIPTWPGSIAAPGAPATLLATLLAGLALFGTAGLLHRPRRPPR